MIVGCGGKVIIDTSGAALRPALEAAPFAWKPNREELEAFLGRELSTQPEQLAAAVELQAKYRISWIVVSDGARGAICVGETEAWQGSITLDPETDVIVNTVGCGDAMVAGMLDSLLRGWTAEAALKRMIAAASANMLSDGAGTILPEHLASMEGKVTVSRL
eukprot:gene14797-7960_t